MLQQDKPGDYVVASGVQYSVKDFVEKAFKVIGITIKLEFFEKIVGSFRGSLIGSET